MEADVATLAKGSRFEDRYEIVEALGSGSFGRVYEARQLSTGQSVAIKLLAPREGSGESTGREVERFRRETRIGATLSHPNLVSLIDAGETRDGQLYAVFAHVPGETLEQVLAREGALGVRESVRLMTQVLEALECAHAKGIVHRDLKPSNLMLRGTAPRRHAVVLDFGLGGLAEGRRRKAWQTLTQTREFLGTPLYASPEQLAGEPASERSDLYAWGLVFLECLTGRHPFAVAGAAERLLTGSGVVEIPEWLQGHRLGELLQSVTARDAAKRDVSSEALLGALDEIARGELPEAPEETPPPAPLGEAGERRHLTVLFCDLVGSSALGQKLETEAYRRLVQAYHARATEAIARFGGHVAQHLGDGLLVYFGYPLAHEDDAERAVRAGREILRALRTLNARLVSQGGDRVQARVGIHTGPVVVGELGGGETKETLALGDTVNVAARLEGFAEPDTMVISDATLRLVAGLFVTEDRGTPALKGIVAPIRAHRVIQPSGITSRLDRAQRLTPFVGREHELGLLLARFAQVRDGRGQAVLLAGEAGIGKSRLVYELRERLRQAHTPHSWLEGRTSPYTQQSAFRPAIELVEQALGLEDELAPDEKVERLERGLAHAGLELGETLPLLASLLSLRLPERYAPLEISPQLQRQKTLEALLAWVLALGEKQPLVLAVEDLHWADPSTIEWLGLVIEQCATAGVLLLLTYRPAFEPPWPNRAHLLAITLGRLERGEAQRLAVEAMPGVTASEALVDRIAKRSDGVPLFVEELARGVAESGLDPAGSLSGLAIPETLQDSLMARLDRLGEAKPVAQLGAAIGREFSYPLLVAVAPLKEGELREGVGQLVEAELVYQRGLPPKAVYTFKHALVQDMAYQSLLVSQRRELHRRIADALATRFPDRVEREPEVMARHSAAAGRTAEAIGLYQRAGEYAKQRCAHAEAVGHLRRAIELLERLPQNTDRDERELQLQLALGTPLSAAKGPGDPEVGQVYARARALCHEVGGTVDLFRALIGLERFYWTRGELETATALAEQALALADQTCEASLRLTAHTALGMNLANRGEPSRALDHLEEAIHLYDTPEGRSPDVLVTRFDAVQARVFSSRTLFLLGHPDRARRRLRQAVELAREENEYGLATMLAVAATLHYRLRERDQTLKRAEEAIAIAQERGLPFPLALAHCYRGWALGGPQGLEELQRGTAQFAAIGTEASVPHHLLAEAYRELGRTEEALAELGGALTSRSQTRTFEAELHRIKGEVLLCRNAPEDAERCFGRALEVAREQGARSLELRAATSLARLLRDRGRGDEARALLQPVYDWFTEGFDTADLKDAKALLEEL